MISTSDWTSKDSSFNYEKMFDSIVDLFKTDPMDPWAVETLEWLQWSLFFSSLSVRGSNGHFQGCVW
jgi:hypothetical protein